MYLKCDKYNDDTSSDGGSSSGEITENVDTGSVLIYLAWFAGFAALSYAVYYFATYNKPKKKKA